MGAEPKNQPPFTKMEAIGNKWATFDEDTGYTEEANLHTKGTIERPGGKLEFWMSIPCPAGVNVDEWDKIQQAKWDRIFGKKSGNN